MKKVRRILRELGITANYTGYYQIIWAVELACQDSEFLAQMIKKIYCHVAERSCSSWKAVERNIRTVVTKAWENNPDLLRRLVGEELYRPPTNSVFLSILTEIAMERD